ncbi:MAG: sigma 54-interacting transcriptional regulator [Treponema sp.]|nr:sigma 54-interacting transcriptional regulator [Treponema sp.]
MDVTVLKGQQSFFGERHFNNLENILFIIPENKLCPELEKIVEIAPFVIPYPCSSHFFKSILEDYLNNYHNRAQRFSEQGVISTSTLDDLDGYFIGNSQKIRKVRQKILDVSEYDSPVLLLGETGTGKSTAAGLIHSYSVRRNNPFIQINLAEIVDSLAESTLFGSTKGSYTGAMNQEGLIKSGDKGTLFFDEAGCASLNTQASLLTFVESKKITKVGSKKSEAIDSRLIFATNANIKKNLENGTFRYDLYYRICDNVIKFPSLRERIEDIPQIVDSFEMNNKILVSKKARDLLLEYNWPGNFRELIKCLSRALAKSDKKEIQVGDIDFAVLD